MHLIQEALFHGNLFLRDIESSKERYDTVKTAFLTGSFRSGTSLLAGALNTHPNVTIGWQPYWLFFKVCRKLFFERIVERGFDADYPMGIDCFTSETERGLFSNVFDILTLDRKELKRLTSRMCSSLSQCSSEEKNMNGILKPVRLANYLEGIEPGTAGAVFSQLLERLWRSQMNGHERASEHECIVGIKEVFCEEYIKPLLQNKDINSVVLHIIRDPRAVVASRNYGKYVEATGSTYPIYFIIRSWKRTVEYARLNAPHHHYLMLQYEDMVAHPAEVFKRICEAVGIEFSEDMLDGRNYKDHEGNLWQGNSSFEGSTAITTSSVDRWRNVLSTAEVELIEYCCQAEMEGLGYDITTTTFDRERIRLFHEDTSRIRKWIGKYDFKYDPHESVGPHSW